VEQKEYDKGHPGIEKEPLKNPGIEKNRGIEKEPWIEKDRGIKKKL